MKLSLSILSGAVLWLGTEASAHAYVDAVERLAALEAQGPQAVQAKILEMRGGNAGTNPFELPPLYTVMDGVAVLEVNGPLVPGNAGFLRLFGVLGYDDIRNAAYDAVSQKSVKSILMVVNSPGGAAAGAEEINGVLQKVASVKPLITYSGTMMASAGYWVGCAAGAQNIYVANTAMIGSVGVIVTHMDYSKQLEKDGITPTIIRSGPYKQMNSPLEPLSDAAKAHMKEVVDDIYTVFSESVAVSLGVDVTKFNKTMGQGREFLGFKAVEVGMATAVMSYDDVFALAKNVDTSKLSRQNSRNSSKDSKMKATLATVIMAQLAAGAAVASLDFTKAEATMEGVAPDAEGQTLLTAQAIQIEAAVKTARETAISAATAPLTAEIGILKATVSTKETELQGLRVTSQALTDQTTKLTADFAATEKVLFASLSAMNVALGAAAPSADLKGSALLAEHGRVETAFAAKFPAGKVTAITTAVEDKPQQATTELPRFAQVAAGLRKA